MSSVFERFRKSEEGVVTVDWTVLTAAIVALAAASYNTISVATKVVAASTGSAIQTVPVASFSGGGDSSAGSAATVGTNNPTDQAADKAATDNGKSKGKKKGKKNKGKKKGKKNKGKKKGKKKGKNKGQKAKGKGKNKD